MVWVWKDLELLKRPGREITKFKVNDEITFGAIGQGAFSDYVILDERAVQIKPSNLTFEQAARFLKPHTLTAYVSLVRRGELTKGETLLVHGSTGGVGMAAVQLGKYLSI